ncbi:MAG: Stage II sporulation protein E (SpoIIE) [Methanosaeta sp. PtaU1.Bin112]|nr:MAG: Stage II sporulation protein E (SpoIIE) [Methanosaeta sp. PtaU1.Bin112]
MAGFEGLRERLLLVLLAFALLPMIILGIISVVEMNNASVDVQSNITSLSKSLNRSALEVGQGGADQVQLAIAKSRQYDEFFGRIASENELVADYLAAGSTNESCTPAGIWVSPMDSNRTTSDIRDATIRSLCAPARIMQALHKSKSSQYLSYIGTEDGVLAVWPYSNKTLSNTALFGYKDMPFYAQSKQKKKTIWTGPYMDSKGDYAITVTTPFYRNNRFAGIAGMDVSLYSIYNDLSSLKGRGYPFIVDSSGQIIYRSKNKPENDLKELFITDNLFESNNPEVRALGKNMIRDSSGSSVIGLEDGDGYVAFSRIATLGWIVCIAYPAEEMSLPARFIDSGVKDVAMSATAALNDASRRVWEYALTIFVLTVFSVLGAGWWMSRRIDGQIESLCHAAAKISRGEFDVTAGTSGELAPLGVSFNKMVQSLKGYAKKQEDDAALREGSGKEIAFLEGIKRNLAPANVPQEEEYEIKTLYWPTDRDVFDLYDISRADDKIALEMAEVGGDGVQAAMLAIMSQTLFRASPDRLNPAKAISELNSQINLHGHGANLACFYALLDSANHTLEYVNAGFNPPFIVDPGGMVDTFGGGGIALGMLDKMEPEKTLIPIQPGDVMVIYSNGVVELENDSGDQFGIERLINLAITNRHRPASEIMMIAEKSLQDYSGSKHSQSDVTLIIIKRD